MPQYSDVSLWMGCMGESPLPRASLPGDIEVDVAIVGGGYTGLWTAYYLKTLAPHLSVAIIEAHICGFGASGRNGGWLMGALEGGSALLAGLDGDRRQLALQSVTGIVSHVGQILDVLNIDCDFHHGGGIYAAARYCEQLQRQRHELQALRASGYREDDYCWLEARELNSRLKIRNPLGAIYTPHVARIHPAKLARELAVAVERVGVKIYEQTRVQTLGAGELKTNHGRVRSATRVLAMEGFSYELLEFRRRVLPIQSMMLATEPLSEGQWQEIGLHHYEVFCDASPLITYGQRASDNRMVFGSRGNYLFGGRPRSQFDPGAGDFVAVHDLLVDCFPQLAGVAVSHRWGGTLGVPRAFQPHAVYDPVSGLGTAGGYLGEGVGASNLMARTLVDLILDRPGELTGMPWAHRRHPDQVLRRWEPEPLRWLGFKAIAMTLGFEESLYKKQAPGWQRKMVGGVSATLGKLLS